MGKRHPNYRLVKIHRNYTVEDVSSLFGVHKNTVRVWLQNGLPRCDSKRPTLVLGHALANFLQVRRMKNKHPCGPGEIYCVRCRAPKHPAGSMAECRATTEQLGNLIGMCPECEGMMYRRVSKARLSAIQGELEITFAKVERQVNESKQPIVNNDFTRE